MDARLNIDFSNLVSCPYRQSWANELTSRHFRLFDRIAHRVYREISSAKAIEDLVQIGNFARIESAWTFVDCGTAQFSTSAGVVSEDTCRATAWRA